MPGLCCGDCACGSKLQSPCLASTSPSRKGSSQHSPAPPARKSSTPTIQELSAERMRRRGQQTLGQWREPGFAITDASATIKASATAEASGSHAVTATATKVVAEQSEPPGLVAAMSDLLRKTKTLIGGGQPSGQDESEGTGRVAEPVQSRVEAPNVAVGGTQQALSCGRCLPCYIRALAASIAHKKCKQAYLTDERPEDGESVQLLDTASVSEEPLPLRTCNVCTDEKPASDFPTAPLTNACTHGSDCCTDCQQTWLKHSLDSNGWIHALCAQCSNELSFADLKAVLDTEAFARYDRLLALRSLGEAAEFQWCPAPQCNNGQIHIGGADAPLFECMACGLRWCTVHNTPWHENQSCRRYDKAVENDRYRQRQRAEQAEQEEASKQKIEATAKKCPGPGCDYYIEKNEGCDAMRCSRCRHKFCWHCFASDYELRAKGNAAHLRSCRYYGTRDFLHWE